MKPSHLKKCQTLFKAAKCQTLFLLVLTGLFLMLPSRGWCLDEQTLSTVRRLAIQYNGRVKPFDSFAREVLTQMTGEEQWRGQDPVATVLSLVGKPSEWQTAKLLSVPFGPLREAIGVDRKAAHVSYADLMQTKALMRRLPPIAAKQQRDEKLTMIEQETMDLYYRFVTFSGLMNGEGLRLVPPGSAIEREWQPIDQPSHAPAEAMQSIQAAWSRLVEDQQSAAASSSTAQGLAAALRALNPQAYPTPWRLQLECLYNQAKPFHIAWMIYALGIVALLLGLKPSRRRWGSVGLALVGAGLAMHATGIIVRVVLAGRAPVSNMYETMFWLAFVLVAAAMIFEAIYRVRFFALAASSVAVITLVLADHLPLDPSISPLVAVLRSNKWLTIHVLTIVASYGALTLAAALAHLYGVFYISSRGRHASLERLEFFLYRAIQVGVLLLAPGIMLGGVWANASWGRYWGWDPKETWALITLLWFVAILHGRHAGWLRGAGMAVATIGGFLLMLMTYYGVNYFLVGLHSYAGGHAKPISPLLTGYLVAEAAFVAWIVLTAQRAQRRTTTRA